MNEQNDARKEFIARMEASGITPPWETIFEMKATIAELRAERDRIRQGAMDADNNVCQILGAALDYPLGEDGRICVGDHVAETLAAEAQGCITRLEERLRGLEFASMEAAQMQADERARRDAALESLDTLLDGLNDPQAGLTHSSIRWFVINTIRVLTGQDEEERREEAAKR